MNIVFQDENFVAVSKPSGLFVHPYKAESNVRECLMKDLRDHLGQYVYPIHRLDRPVSGIVLFGLNSGAVRDMKAIWSEETTHKKYICLVRGILTEAGQIDFPLTDKNKVPKESLTLYQPIYQFPQNTLLEVEIKTGRQHQIRRHLSRRMHQIIGDTRYGKGGINHLFRDRYGLKNFSPLSSLKFYTPL